MDPPSLIKIAHVYKIIVFCCECGIGNGLCFGVGDPLHETIQPENKKVASLIFLDKTHVRM